MAIEVNAMFKVCIAVLTFVALTLAFPDNSYGKDKRDTVAPPALPICSVLAKAAEYDGKEVTVGLTYYLNIEGGMGGGPECPHENVGLRNAPDFKESKRIRKAWGKMGKHGPVYLVVRGTFTVCREGNCFVGMYWAPYRIEVREDLFVRPVLSEPN